MRGSYLGDPTGTARVRSVVSVLLDLSNIVRSSLSSLVRSGLPLPAPARAGAGAPEPQSLPAREPQSEHEPQRQQQHEPQQAPASLGIGDLADSERIVTPASGGSCSVSASGAR